MEFDCCTLITANIWAICSVIHASEINYLCVHKKLRSKRLAPVLIKEVTRQCHLKGIFQAIYTAGIVIPTPVAVCRYYHRLLNIPKLVNTRFCFVPRSMTLARMIRVNKVSAATTLPGLREMQEKDIVAVTQLLTEYMRRFTMVPLFDIDEARHQFLSGIGKGEIGSGGPNRREKQVTFSYVVEVRIFTLLYLYADSYFLFQNPDTGKITDFFSFYSLPSTVIGNTSHPILQAAYLYYYATDSGLQGREDAEQLVKKRLYTLIGDAIIVANEAGFDVFNALTLMDNVSVLHDLKVCQVFLSLGLWLMQN